MSSSLAALGLMPVTSSGAAAAVELALSAASACVCARACMKLGPSDSSDWAEAPLAPAAVAELAADCAWLDEVLCFDWALAAVFFTCVLEVALRFELPDLPDIFAAVLLEPSLDPDFELEDDVPAEELAELPPVPDELDEEEEERTAALGGVGATGIEKRGSRATRSHSLRPNAL